MITRRSFTRQAMTIGMLSLTGGRLWAATEADLGGLTLTTLSDGHLTLPESFLYGDLDREEINRILAMTDAAKAPGGGLEPPCNLTLLRRDDALVLFDAGAGSGFMPSAGKLPEALDAAGVSADEITHVVFTHGHPDHLWGVLDDFDEPVFANAVHLMGGVELAYWVNPETLETIGAERQSFAAGASRRLELLGDRVEAFADGDEVVPGVTAMATPGHTPGHMSFEIAGTSGRLVVIGDAIGSAHMALARPDWAAPADQDPETGAATRTALLGWLAEEEVPVVGFHLPNGGLGRIVRDGNAYGWNAS